MGDYASTDEVRDITGLSTTNISDANLEDVITLAETQIDDAEAEISLGANQKKMATIYLTASLAMSRRASSSAGGAGGSYSFGPLRVDEKSAQQMRMSLAKSFRDMYDSILSSATSDIAIRKID